MTEATMNHCAKPLPVEEPTARQTAGALFPIDKNAVSNIRRTLMETPCSICLERPGLMIQARIAALFRKKKHPLVRRAECLAFILERRTPRIYPFEAIAGNMSSKRIAANYYPEGGSSHILEDLFNLDKRAVPLALSFSEKVCLLFTGIVTFHWSTGAKAFGSLSRMALLWTRVLGARSYILTEIAGVSHQIPDYDLVVTKGLCFLDDQAKTALEQGITPEGEVLDDDQRAFYQSVRIVLAGIRTMAANLETEALRLASLSEGEENKRVLGLAQNLARVPWHPAHTFQEGLQACWLVHVAMNMEDYEQGLSFGRLDQILYPLFEKDMAEGRLNEDTAKQLIASFQLKACETIPLFSRRMDAYFSGNTVGQGITLGGTDAQGRDATNMLSGLFLDAFLKIRTREPNLHARIHENTPSWFLEKCAGLIGAGCGNPAFFGDEAVVRALTRAGMTIEDAREYGVIGCVELGCPGKTYHSSDAGLFNVPACLELALSCGRGFGKSLFAPWAVKTPLPETMTSFDDVLGAFTVQVDAMIADAVPKTALLENANRQHRTAPINSMLTKGCMARGMDATWGGAHYDFTSYQAVGLADVADSLMVIQKAVFEEKKLSLDALVRTLKTDFRDAESLRLSFVTRYPKYGNGDPGADAMFQRVADMFTNAVMRHTNTRGGRFLAGMYSMTCHTAFGTWIGATASGRRAGTPLANGFSPASGADRTGPTALLRSAASLDTSAWANGGALNLRLGTAFVKGRSGEKLLAGLLRSYLVTQGGMQVQLNALDADTLKQAKANPGLYPGLLVRIAGYCAYFQDLAPEVQDELIERTIHG